MSTSTEFAPILARLQSTLTALDGLRRQLSLPPSVGGRGAVGAAGLPAVIAGFREAFISYSISTVDQFSRTTLRPVSPNAIWSDQPSLKSRSVYARPAGRDSSTWKAAFPDYMETVTNVIGNERYITVEFKGAGTHLGPLKVGAQTIAATKRHFEIHAVNVVTLDGGYAVRFEQYYDLAGPLRQLGMLPDVAMGHDEPVPGSHGQIPPLMHPAGGFLGGSPESWPIVVGKAAFGSYNVSIGRSTTPQAQANTNNCKAIHAAFVDHTPEKFQALVARD
jgi:hypothetical protein